MIAIERPLRELLMGASTQANRQRTVIIWLTSICLGGGFYGAIMGSFSGLSPDRLLQVLYSTIKVPILLIATTLLATPSFFVLNTILGLRNDFASALRAVLGTQAVISIILAGLAPYTALWYFTSGNYYEATSFNAFMFALASFIAQWQLRHRYKPLEKVNPRHRHLRRTWVYLYAFVGIQMGWVLRPFIGDPGREPTFFRPEAWGNAYIKVWETLVEVLGLTG